MLVEKERANERWRKKGDWPAYMVGIIWHLMDRFVRASSNQPRAVELLLRCDDLTVPHFLLGILMMIKKRDFHGSKQKRNQRASESIYRGRYWVKAGPCHRMDALSDSKCISTKASWSSSSSKKRNNVGAILDCCLPSADSLQDILTSKKGDQCDTRTCQYLSLTQ